MIEYNTDIPIPEIGDRITYRDRICSATDALVTNTDDRGGYTDIYLNNARKSLFNINHYTGDPNTYHSEGGRWEFAEAPEVREWQVPVEPTDCKRVIATDGTDEVYTYNASSVVVPWVQASSGRPCTWSEVLDAHAGVREHVQTDYEAAVEYFAKMNLRGRGVNLSRDEAKKHARAIIAHVIGEK